MLSGQGLLRAHSYRLQCIHLRLPEVLLSCRKLYLALGAHLGGCHQAASKCPMTLNCALLQRGHSAEAAKLTLQQAALQLTPAAHALLGQTCPLLYQLPCAAAWGAAAASASLVQHSWFYEAPGCHDTDLLQG